MQLGRLYFFTATIHDWIPLLGKRDFKEIILASLGYLVDKKYMKVYGFVIMPNHVHLILENIKLNGRENPSASLLKFTGHRFLKKLMQESPDFLHEFKVNQVNKTYEFWQRDSLAVELYSPNVVYQKLEYIHNNPCQKKWMLSFDPISYPYSSFNFYETNSDSFGFLSHIGERL